MSDLVTRKDSRPDQPHRPDVSTVMNTALAPFRLHNEWSKPIGIAWNAYDLVARDRDGELVALKHAADQPQRWQLHCRAYSLLEELPTQDQIVAAYEALRVAIMTEPTVKQKQLLLGLLLDGCSIKAGPDIDKYIQLLTWMLGDCPPSEAERRGHPAPPRWIPLAAIAKAIKHVLATRRNDDGRPVPIAEFLDECCNNRRKLISARSDIRQVGLTHQRLTEIVKATEDSYPDDDWLDGGKPQEGSKSKP